MYVKPKKALGQHFLRDEDIAFRIVEALEISYSTNSQGREERDIEQVADKHSEGNIAPAEVIEVGPGTGVLTKYLLGRKDVNLKLIDIDTESIQYLLQKYPQVAPSLYEADFLKIDLSKIFAGAFMVIGNFPYNISSQIFFKILDYKDNIPQVVGMLQKEVAERIASAPGKKAYGILSVLLQAWYDIEYLFTVEEHVFDPPPKVKSAVIRLRRNSRTDLGCDQDKFKDLIKTCFNQRRKTIRNSIKPYLKDRTIEETPEIKKLFERRPEQLSVEEFIRLTLLCG